MWRDGFHVDGRSRHLLVKSVAAAVAGVDAHRFYGRSGPPLGPYGPWVAPQGQGFSPMNFRDVAMGHPFQFRKLYSQRPRSLMDIKFTPFFRY